MPTPTHLPTRLPASLLAALLSTPTALLAADAPSRITSIKLYPGSATVERSLQLPAGAHQASFACLPAGLDIGSLRVQADEGIRVGDLNTQTQTREQAGPLCADTPLQASIRRVQEQLDQLGAEAAGLDAAANYLRGYEQASPGNTRPTPALPQLTASTQALRQTAADLARQKARIERQRAELEAELKQLHAERDRSGGQNARVHTVRVTLHAPRGGQLRLIYQVRGPSWQPGYRATLDTARQNLLLERQALVTQNTGEDWTQVPLTLSTGRPGSATQSPLPGHWRLNLAPPPQAQPPAPAAATGMARSKAPEALDAAEAAEAAQALAQALADGAAPTFGISTAETGFATEFVVVQPVTVPSSGQRVSLSLSEHQTSADVSVRTAPMREAAAYLVATVPTPLPGVWPGGPVSLYRDGAYVGNALLAPEQLASHGLAFGRDELVTVRVQPPEQQSGSSGLISTQNERRDTRRFSVENRHRNSIALQVLDAAPISQHEQVRVQSRYQPEPASTRWNQQPGQIEWRQTLAAGASQSFEAEHRISWPQDARLSERR